MSVLSFGAARAAVVTVAAASAFALLALPSAAHAAEVVTCSQQATAETQPWLTLSTSENFYADYALALDVYFDSTLELTYAFPESFDEAVLDKYEQAIVAASDTLESDLEAIVTDNGLTTLIQQLTAADPENTTGWNETLSTLFSKVAASADEPAYEAALDSFTQAQLAFSNDAAALVEADVPAGGPFDSPVVPESLASDAATIEQTLDGLVTAYQTFFIDGAAAFVVYEEVCATTTVPDTTPAVAASAPAKTLAATGTSDGVALGTAAGLLLLIGAAVTVVSARRRSA